MRVVSTPIGNLGDFSPRALEVLSAVETWVVERRSTGARLGSALGVRRPMRVLDEHSSETEVEALAALAQTSGVALLTDAGTPGISDPGALLIDRCLDLGVAVSVLPGPSAVTAALSASGFFAQRFAFLGFLPRRAGDAAHVLAPFAESSLTLVLFESPHRLTRCLPVLGNVLGERRYALCRELTKMHEQVWRGRLPDVPCESDVPRRGEFTIVVEGNRKRSETG